MARKLNLISVAAAAASLAVVATPAFASAPFTVSYDGSTTGNYAITATAKGTTVFSFNGNTVTCSNSSMGATVHAGTSTTGSTIATINSATWSTCTMAGYPITVTVTTPNWGLNLNSTDTQSSGLTDTLAGTITNVSNLALDMNLGFGHCTFNLNGSLSHLQFLEDNGKGGQEIDINASSGLMVNNTSPACLGLVNNGNAATFSGQYNFSGQHINIS